MIDALLRACFDVVPDRVDAVIDRALARERFVDFKLGLVLPSSGRPPRVAVSDLGEADVWAARIATLWPDPRLPRFLGRAPGARRMVDTDGTDAVVFLDDLHEVDHDLPTPRGTTLMCVTARVPGGPPGFVTRHPVLPPHVPESIRAAAEPLRHEGGVWGLRFEAARPYSALWISESRWRGNADHTAGLVRHVPRWDACATILEAQGLRIYPDAIEVLTDGSWDVTVGAVGAPASAAAIRAAEDST